MKRLFEADTICRLCLRVDEKANRLNNTDMKAFIESIIVLKQSNYVPTEDLYLCYICSALLTKSFNFMQTIWSAQKIICTVLKNTNMITKRLLYCIDRQNTGLNPITLSSVVTYWENVKCDSSNNSNTNTDIKEPDFEVFIKKEEPRKKKKKKKNTYMNKTKNFTDSTNENKLIISKGDEDEESDKCNLDEIEVEICNNFEIDGIKAESSDPLTKELNTDACNEPIPETKQKRLIKKKNVLKKEPSLPTTSKDTTSKEKKINYIDTSDDDENLAYIKIKRVKVNKEEIDDDYQPDSTSHSEKSSDDSYDDEGKAIKRPEDNRVYPMQCDHCDFEVREKRNHYRHYQFNHPNIEYPYRHQKEYACSICGKLCTKLRIASHEATHTTQELKCYFCPKVFPDKIKRQRHLSNVHPKKTYTCEYCSKIHKTREGFIRHIRTHTGSKPFKCHICGDGFAHSGNRSVHIRAIHQNYRYVAKKQKQAQTVRRKKKHRSTDTEISCNSEKTVRKTKTKRKSNNQSENTETTLKKKKKSTKKVSKNKEMDGTETSVVSEDGKQNKKKKKKTEMVSEINLERHNKNYENAEMDSDDEFLAVVKRKNTQDGPVSQKAKQVDEENKVK